MNTLWKIDIIFIQTSPSGIVNDGFYQNVLLHHRNGKHALETIKGQV